MFKFIYATDLHGQEEKFNTILTAAKENSVNLIHLGADILPKGPGMLEIQKRFVKGYLKDFYKKTSEAGMNLVAFFGNDDIWTRKRYFTQYASLLDESPHNQGGYEFKAYGYVQDYPFKLKTACKLDYPGWELKEPLKGIPMDFNEAGQPYDIEGIKKYFEAKGTIEGDLKEIQASSKTIMAIHQPPWSLGLDVCIGGRLVGSKAVYDWATREQPLMLLCGHIHESYDISGIWKQKVGRTTVIQPGQSVKKTRFVYIEIEDETLNAEIVTL